MSDLIVALGDTADTLATVGLFNTWRDAEAGGEIVDSCTKNQMAQHP